MEFRSVGGSGLRVSVAGLGCNNFGGRIDEDATRAVGPLAPAADAVTVYTDGLTLEEVVEQLQRLAAGK